MSIHGVLGESTNYPKTYDPTVLYPIKRQIGRDEIVKETGFVGEYHGVDIWQAFELSWLNEQGISQVAMARIGIPADSPCIVESKSLKLYFNSLNFSEFANQDSVKQTICQDVSTCVGARVSVELFGLDASTDETCDHQTSHHTIHKTNHPLQIFCPIGLCIDGVLDGSGQKIELCDDINSTHLQGFERSDEVQGYAFYSNLLRSNCPVTNQPDWGTVQIQMQSQTVPDFGKILAYILSFRQHNGFHEQCVERIFADFMQVFAPKALCVQANYTRRGGIDINPVRVFNMDVPTVARLIRQ